MFVDTFHAIVSSVQYSTHTCSDRARQYSYARPSFRSEEPSRTEQRVLQHSPTAVLELYPFYRELGVEIAYSSLLWLKLSYRLFMLLCLSESGRDECLTYRPCCSLHCLFNLLSCSSMPPMEVFLYRLCLYKCHSRFAEGGSCFYLSNPASKWGTKRSAINETCRTTTIHAHHVICLVALPLKNRQVRSTNILCTAHASHTAPTRYYGRMSG